MRTELLPDGHIWLRIANPTWKDPLDPSFAQARGERWNPPGSFPVLYMNEDVVTARLNLRKFVSGWPYEPEDLRDETGPALVSATLPRHQRVADGHTPAGVKALGLPASYPLGPKGELVGHDVCHPIGVGGLERRATRRCGAADRGLSAPRESLVGSPPAFGPGRA